MNCPYCDQPMHKGYLHDFAQPVQWIPEGTKPSIWRGGVADGGVSFGSGNWWKGYRAKAFCCAKCKLVILSADSTKT